VSEAFSVEERGAPRQRRLGLAVGALGFVALLLWPDLPLDALQRRVAAVTFLTASLWVSVAIPVGAASLLPAALLPLLGVLPARAVAPLYMSDLVLLFIGAFIVALGLERWDVHRRMALWILARVGASPRRLVFGFMAASAFISMWINNTATTLLMLPIAMAVISKLRPSGEGANPFAYCLLLGVAYSASVGGICTPVGTAPNQVFLGQFADRFPDAPKVAFGDWLLAWLPLALLFVPIAWLLLTTWIFPLRPGSPAVAQASGKALDVGEVIRTERRSLGPFTRPQLTMSVVFALTALLWITRSDLVIGDFRIPGWNRLLFGPEAADPAWYSAHKNDVSDATVATVMALLCFLLPAGDGKGSMLMTWRVAVRLPWDVLLLLGAGFCLANAFKVSGLDVVLGQSISPLLSGHSSWLIVGCVALLVSFLTELTSNTATTAVLLPVMAAAAVDCGRNPLLVMLPTTIAASAAFMLPVATPPNAVVFSSRQVPMPVMARAGILLNLLAVILITLVFELWVRRVWNIGDGLPDWAMP
jgi:sodium-dependent dicarboxylate transporter 2/3/5